MKIFANRWPWERALGFSNAATIVVGLTVALLVYYTTSYVSFEGIVYNADALYLPALYRDLAAGNSFAAWNLPPASFLFPDTLLFFLVSAATPTFHAAIVAFGISQYLLFALGLMLLARQTLPPAYGFARYGLVALMGLLFLTLIDRLEFYSQLIFLSVHHFGVALLLPFVLTLLLQSISSPRTPIWQASALAILSFLAGASDGIYLIQVTGPLVVALGVLFWLDVLEGRRALLLGGVLLAASLLGALAIRLVLPQSDLVAGYLTRFHLAYFALLQLLGYLTSAWSAKPLHFFLAAGFLLVCALGLWRSVRKQRRGDPSAANAARTLLTTFFLVSTAASVFFITLFGLFVDRHALRYFLPLLIFSGFWGWPFVLALPKAIFPRTVRVAVPVAILLVAGLAIQIKPARNPLANGYYPTYIQCIDEHARQLDLREGIAQFWQARPLTLLGQSNLRVAQVNRDLSPYNWVNSSAEFEIAPQFAVIDLTLPAEHPSRLDESLLVARFGEPDTTFQCEQSRILVYTRAESRLKSLFDVP